MLKLLKHLAALAPWTAFVRILMLARRLEQVSGRRGTSVILTDGFLSGIVAALGNLLRRFVLRHSEFTHTPGKKVKILVSWRKNSQKLLPCDRYCWQENSLRIKPQLSRYSAMIHYSRLSSCVLITILLVVGCGSWSQAFSQGYGYSAPQSSGVYEYSDGTYGAVSDAAINGAFDTAYGVGGTVDGAGRFLNDSMSFGAWRSSNYGGVGGGATLGLQMQSQFLGINGLRPGLRPGNVRGVKFGPFYITNMTAGAGVLYSDYQGTPLYGGREVVGDDNWAAIVWASAQMTTYITDRFALTLEPFVYYLPLKNQVGWGIAAPFVGGFGAGFNPNALLRMAYRVPVEGGVEILMFDEFRATFANGSFLAETPAAWITFADSTPIDYAGRYAFGAGGSRQIDADGRSDFALNDEMFGTDQLWFTNQAGIMARGIHGDSVRTAAYYTRFDTWDSNFDNHSAWNTAGALVLREGPFITPYALYEINSRDDFETWYQQVIVGANVRLTPNLIAYAQAGWLWAQTENEENYDTWIAQAGFRQRLGPYTFHGLDAGRSPVGSFGTRYLADFVRYYLQQQLGPQAVGRLFVEKADLKTLGGESSFDRSTTTVGVSAEMALSPRSAVGVFASYENVDIPAAGRGFELWTYRAYYNRRFSNTVQGNIYYQYQQAGSGVSIYDQFSEHLLFIGVTKQF
jgi:hypothetical protein